MKKYEKENQIYSCQEGSALEQHLKAQGFKEVVEEAAKKTKPKADKSE